MPFRLNMRRERRRMGTPTLWLRPRWTSPLKSQSTYIWLTMPGHFRLEEIIWWRDLFGHNFDTFRLLQPDSSWSTLLGWVPGWLLSWTLSRMMRRWIFALMDIEENYVAVDLWSWETAYVWQVVEEVLKERWKFSQTYSLGGATAEERQPVWYLHFSCKLNIEPAHSASLQSMTCASNLLLKGMLWMSLAPEFRTAAPPLAGFLFSLDWSCSVFFSCFFYQFSST